MKVEFFELGGSPRIGRREFYYYSSEPSTFEKAVKNAMKCSPDYEFDWGTQNDPSWNQYLNVLFPDEDDLQKMLNREVLDVMGENGDKPETPREVLHWVYFTRESDRSDFEAALQIKGYRIESETHHSGEENPYSVCFGKVQECTGEAIDKVVSEMTKLAEQFQGNYDGWEAQVMSDESETSTETKWTN
jgi:regulator of RNase E activity RraB